MRSFNHINANMAAEAVKLLKDHEGRAKLLAGGTDLLGELKDKVLEIYPELLINIKTIPDMDYINEEAGILKIGALTKLRDIVTSPLVKEKYDILSQAAFSVGTPQIRNAGTIGGNLCQDVRCWYYRYPRQIGGENIMCRRKGSRACGAVSGDNRYHAILEGNKCFAVCPSDMAVALAALDAEVIITGPDGERSVAVQDMFHTMGNALAADEIVTEIRVPQPPEKSRQTFIKLRMRNSIDFAIVSVAAIIFSDKGVCRNVRIALGAVAARPVRALEAESVIRGKAIDEKTAELAAEATVTGAVPLSNNAYKIQETKTLVKRAILA